MEFISLFSVSLFLVSLIIIQKVNLSTVKKSIFSFTYLSYVFLFIFNAIIIYFTEEGLNSAVIFHLRFGLSGAGFLEYWEIIAVTLFGLIFSLVLLYFLLKKGRRSNGKRYFEVAIILILISLLLNPGLREIYGYYTRGNANSSQNFNEYYQEPDISQVNQNKNIVFIYAESLEQTYFDENIFPGLMTNLKELQNQSTYFTQIKQVTNTNWTIAGKVASQGGIPLFTTSQGNSMRSLEKFLPAAITLGDLLKQEDYYLSYYGGADLSFAGKGNFYKTHGFDEVYGINNLSSKVNIDDLPTNSWGLYDKDLFDIAYDSFIELSKTKEKFGLFLLTIGTHHPRGHKNTNVEYKDGNNEMLNAVAASDKLISDFVNEILQSPYKDETVIVIASDHLAMKNQATDLLNKGDRTNLFMVIDPQQLKKNEIDKTGSLLDVAPTLLPYVGYEGKIGLGRNLLDSETNPEEISLIHDNLISWKPQIIEFWDFPIVRESIFVNIESETASIDEEIFEIPILIELDEDLNTVLKFDSNAANQRLLDYLFEVDEDKHFIYVDKSETINKLDSTLYPEGYSMILGKDNKIKVSKNLNDNITLDANNLSEIIDSDFYLKEYWQSVDWSVDHPEEYSLYDITTDIKNNNLVVISVRDEASTNLSNGFVNLLEDYNSEIPNLSFRDSYAAIFYNDKLIEEKLSSDSFVHLEELIEGYNVKVASGGYDKGNFSSIKINDQEFSLNKRGLNIVVVSDVENNILSSLNFDVYSGDYESGF